MSDVDKVDYVIGVVCEKARDACDYEGSFVKCGNGMLFFIGDDDWYG